MNLHLLRVFFAVAEHQSFSRAGEALSITQPAVSKAVRELERQLDLILIERRARGGGRGIHLTDAGEALREHARGIFALERAAADEARSRALARRGRLAIGASTTVAGYWLPEYAAQFARSHPQAQLRVLVANTQAVARALIECEIELGMVEGPVQDARIQASVWRDDELRVVVAAQSPVLRKRRLTPQDLKSETWLLREAGSGTREVAERMLRTRSIRPARVIELGSNECIARAVAAGLGIALLPTCVVRELAQTGAVRALPQSSALELKRPLYLLQLRARPATPLVRDFCALLAAAPGAPAHTRLS